MSVCIIDLRTLVKTAIYDAYRIVWFNVICLVALFTKSLFMFSLHSLILLVTKQSFTSTSILNGSVYMNKTCQCWHYENVSSSEGNNESTVFIFFFNHLSANLTKWSNRLKQFFGKLPTNCLSAFDYFVGLAFKRLITSIESSHFLFYS